MRTWIKATWILAVIGIVSSLIAAIMLLRDCAYGDAVSTVSTSISVVLGIISILYTYVSGEETLKALNEIRRENQSLVQKINYELAKNNYDEENISNLLKKNKDKT